MAMLQKWNKFAQKRLSPFHRNKLFHVFGNHWFRHNLLVCRYLKIRLILQFLSFFPFHCLSKHL